MDIKDTLLNEAFALFATSSYSDVSLEEILSKAQVTEAEFKNCFSSKLDLFKELIDTYVLSPMDQLKDYLSGLNTDPEEDFNTIFYSFIYINDEMCDLLGKDQQNYNYYMLYFSALQHVEGFNEKISTIYNGITAAIKTILQQMLREKKSIDDNKFTLLSEEITALCHGICMMWILDNKKDYKALYLEACENMKNLILKL